MPEQPRAASPASSTASSSELPPEVLPIGASPGVLAPTPGAGAAPAVSEPGRVHPAVAVAAEYSWRLIVIGVVVLAALWLLSETRVVFLPLVVALVLTRALSPVSGWLVRHRVPASAAAVATLLGFFVLVAGLLALIVPSMIGEFDSVGPTVTEAVDDVEDWLVDDSPFELALWLSGGGLVAPVMVLTFLGAYVPIVGATVAGVVAVLVALVTGGTGSAVVVAIVVLMVQQLDNDLLAPVIYGRALSLHPAVILVSVVAGGALFGLSGTILAVPTVAVGVNVVNGYRNP